MRSEVEKLEKQFRKVYLCLSCGRILHLARHESKCPFCGGKLAVKVFVEKK
jgi:DNA-directed RNA polymerase subunit RPC12/RpoP